MPDFRPSSPKLIPAPKPTPRQMLSAAADAGALTWFQSKLIQPDWRPITFDGSQGITQLTDYWTGSWTVQSILLVNPYDFPVYVSANGNPLLGMPFPPQQALRVPIAGANGNLVLGVDPTQLGDNVATVQLFRYPTAD